MAERCHVADERCQLRTRKHCFACGLPVCGECSLIRSWYRWRRKRICANCDEDEHRFRQRREAKR